jgi:hypothetical protein
MRFVVHDEPGDQAGLGRLAAERRLEARLDRPATTA